MSSARRLVGVLTATVLLVVPAPSAAATPSIEALSLTKPLQLISTSDAGVKGNDSSNGPDVSSSGAQVAFMSQSTNLDPSDTDSLYDVYVKDSTTGDLVLVSASDTGTKGNDESRGPAISGSGDTVAFSSESMNLDPADTNTREDIFVKTVSTGAVRLASTTLAGIIANGFSLNPDLSGSGNRVAFYSSATNLHPLDTDTSFDVFVKDLSTGAVFLASAMDNGFASNGSSLISTIAASGNRVAFQSDATNLDPGDTDTTLDIYVKDLTNGDVMLASASDAGTKGNDISLAPSLSASGARVAFQSAADNLDPADPDTLPDIYVKNLNTGDIQLVSTSDSGVKGNGSSQGAALSNDGRRVAFSSTSTNLDPADTDGTSDLYVKDLVTGDIALASTTAEGLKGNQSSHSAALTGQGRRVAFQSSATNLDPADTSVLGDVYVAQPVLCTIVGTAADDTLVRTSGNDVICGRGGDDSLFGVAGDDLLFGEDGGDVLDGGAGADAVDGGSGAGEDVVSYQDSPAAVDVDLSLGTGFGGDAEGDTVDEVESIIGTPFADELIGDSGANEIAGDDGDDVLTGGGGADILEGGLGLDLASYAASYAAVVVDVGAGTASGGTATGDLLDSIEGAVGSAFADTLTGDSADNVFMGMGSGDVLDAGAGFDLVYYLYSPTGVTVDLAAQTASGGHATGDSLAGFEGVLGSTLADVLNGSNDVNHLLGSGGDDTLVGLGGDDVLVGSTGTDSFSGGGGFDTCDNVVGEVVTSCEL